ncbi:MAG: CTP synthase, partial [bacterium]
EVNNQFIDLFEKHGMIAAGINPGTELVEIVELKDHPWFIGVQFHPELKSRVLKAHPLFREFVKAALIFKNEN